jgi:hypothetical protein
LFSRTWFFFGACRLWRRRSDHVAYSSADASAPRDRRDEAARTRKTKNTAQAKARAVIIVPFVLGFTEHGVT